MDKQSFLCSEYERLMSSGEYVWSGWRDSFERFQADLWDMTPTSSAGRYLAPKDMELGFSPDNVEWHFRKISPIGKTTKVKNKVNAPPSRTKKAKRAPLTAAEKKSLAEIAKEQRRRKLAEEFEYWERKRNSSSDASKRG